MASTYTLTLAPGGDNVGIWLRDLNQAGQAVRLDADFVEWNATPPLTGGGGPTRLNPLPYRYTQEYQGEVFATNDPNLSKVWFLIPANDEDTYIIAADPQGITGWTAGEPGEPISIANIQRGTPNQSFRIVPA